jgi:phage shock protein PspC (stress-responsive transcriptional regulator)
MNRVITVNLAGNAYQLDEGGHDVLKAYLDVAARTLGANPDASEILHDLERAIADRFAAGLHAFKTVVTTAEVEAAIAAMGPVDDADPGSTQSAGASTGTTGPRRLYRLREGAIFAGVTTGIAAYTRIDLSIVRIGLVLLALFAFWLVVIGYLVAMFVIPTADTPQDWRAAHGLPATAQEVIDNAKARFADLEAKRGWFSWAQSDGGRASPRAPQTFTAPPGPAAGIGVRVLAGVGALILSCVGAAATLALAFALGSLITSGEVAGYAPYPGVPDWLALALLAVVFAIITLPLQALRESCFRTLTGMDRTRARNIDAWASSALVLAGGWALFQFVPEVREVALDVLALIQDRE